MKSSGNRDEDGHEDPFGYRVDGEPVFQ